MQPARFLCSRIGFAKLFPIRRRERAEQKRRTSVKLKRLSISVLILSIFIPALAGQETKEISLTLEESILKAMKNNLNLAVEVYNPDLAVATLDRAKEAFLPTLDFSFNRESDESPSYWWLQASGTSVSKVSTYAASVAQPFPWGGSLAMSLTNYRSETNESFQLLNPRYGSTLKFDFTQPLLKNFGAKVARQEILVARNNLDISERQLESTLMNTIYQVQEAYWNLVYAVENLDVNRQSLQLARDLLAKNKKEAEVGTLAPLEVLNAEATVAQREADILQAEALIKKNEEVLKSLISPATDGGEIRGLKIVPADKPQFKPMPVSVEAALKQAMEQRPDLDVNRATIQNNEISFSVAKNQLLPQLDLAISYWSPGISGDRILYLDDNPLTGVVIGTQPGGSSKAIQDAMKFMYQNWTAGVTLTIPLNNILGRANYALAKLQLDQSIAKLKTQEQQIFLDVSDAVRSVETDAKRVDAYRIARELAEKRLEAETKKLNVGLTTNYFVLEYQKALADARSMEIKAMVDYSLSQARLEKAVGSSLASRNISVMNFNK
jgi:outer membrane protein TolC